MNAVKIDHIGFVVDDIAVALDRYTAIYGLARQSEVIFDPAQRVKLVMLSSANGYNIELIQPIDNKSPSYDYIKKGGGFHHFCYAVESMENTISRMKSCGHLLIKRPIEAPLLEGRLVAFFYSKIDKQVVELVETTSGSNF